MSSLFATDSPAGLVKRFVETTSGYSLRGAGKLADVSHSLVDTWRKWVAAGANAATLPPPEAETLQKLGDYLAVAEEVEIRRVALHLAADRLEDLARQLREEATSGAAGALAATDDASRSTAPPERQAEVGAASWPQGRRGR